MSRYRILVACWLVSDVLVFLGSYAVAYFLRVGWIFSTDFPFDRLLAAVATVAPIWLLVLATTRTFALTRNQKTLRNAAYIAYSALVGVALFSLTYYFQFGIFFSRLLLVEAFAFSAAAVWLWHMAFQEILRRVLRRSPPAFPTLIVGVTRESKRLIANLNHSRNPLTPVAILDGRGTSETLIDGVPVKGKLNKLEEVLERDRITHVIQASDMEQTLNLLTACRQRGIHYIVLPSVFGIVEGDETVESLEGQPATVVRPGNSKIHWFFR